MKNQLTELMALIDWDGFDYTIKEEDHLKTFVGTPLEGPLKKYIEARRNLAITLKDQCDEHSVDLQFDWSRVFPKDN